MKIGILESKNFSAEATARLNRLGEVFHYTKGSVSNFIRDKEVLFVRLKYMLDEKFLGYAKALEYLCSPTTGLNHIDLRYIAKKKIDLISLNGERQFLNQIKATPEHGLGLILSLLRNYKDAYLGKQNDQWDRERFVGEELFENKVGIIGFGRVGSILAKYVTAMGSDVLFFDPNNKIKYPKNVRKSTSIERLINLSNIIILCASYRAGQKRVLDKKLINAMKGKYFVNIARGELLDENHLISKISASYFKGIALDVIQGENSEKNNLKKLISLSEKNNLILTPHIAGVTVESFKKTELFIVKKLAKNLTISK